MGYELMQNKRNAFLHSIFRPFFLALDESSPLTESRIAVKPCGKGLVKFGKVW